jgi:hypothetical protein
MKLYTMQSIYDVHDTRYIVNTRCKKADVIKFDSKLFNLLTILNWNDPNLTITFEITFK